MRRCHTGQQSVQGGRAAARCDRQSYGSPRKDDCLLFRFLERLSIVACQARFKLEKCMGMDAVKSGWGTIVSWAVISAAASAIGTAAACVEWNKSLTHDLGIANAQVKALNVDLQRVQDREAAEQTAAAAELQRARQQAESNQLAAQAFPSWQVAANTCLAKLSDYEKNNPILQQIQEVQGYKNRIDDGIGEGFVPLPNGYRKITTEAEVADLRTRSAQYQDQLISLQAKLQCSDR